MQRTIQGKAVKLGSNINTDFIISGRYKFSITNIKELSKHIMEDIDPSFPSRIVPGKSIIVAGDNFGMGSSREQAPLVIKECGIIACLSKSFARIFYRNAFNIGLPLAVLNTDKIDENDLLDIDLNEGRLKDLTKQIEFKIEPLPVFMQQLLNEGGALNYYKKYRKLPEVSAVSQR